jgi:hypothetical protein
LKQNIQFDEKDIFVQTVPLDGIFGDIGQEVDANVPEKSGKNVPEKLKNRGILERVGADKGGYWKIIK